MNNSRIASSVRQVLALALLAGTAPGVALAQQAPATSAAGEELEEVVVYGVRASIIDAIGRKRDSDIVMDAISAEDIGKFPDENVGEALQRIPGMSLDREAGEGKGVSIRGLGAGLSQVTMNGQRMASTEGNREFNFSVVDSSIVQALEVWKTPMASQDEGSVGGTVNIVTRGPLDYRRTRLNLGVTGEFEELADEWGDKYTGDLQTQNDAGTLGFGVSANYSSRTTRSDQVIIPGWALVDSSSSDWTARGWNTLAAKNGLDYIFYPLDASSRTRVYDRERTGVNPTLQWRPTDNLEFRLDYYYSKLEDYDDNQTAQVRIRDLVSGNGRNVNNYAWQFNGNAAVFFDATKANINNAWRGYRNTATLRENSWTSDGYNLEVTGSATEDTEVTVSIGRSVGDGVLKTYPVADFQDAIGFSVDLRDNPKFFDTTINGGGMDDSLLDLRALNINDAFDEEVQEHFQFDFVTRLDGNHFSAVRGGAKYHSARTGHKQIRHDNSSDGTAGYTLADFAKMCGNSPCRLDNFEYQNRSSAPLNGTFTFVDFGKVLDVFPRDSRTTSVRYNESFKVEEETIAVFVQGDLDGQLFGVPYRGNLGVRYYRTNLVSSGWLDQAGTMPGKVERSYDDILPSLNLAFELRDDLLLRTGLAKVMARPDQEDLSLAGTFNLTEQTARVGNPKLDPFEAVTFDLGLEWYFSRAGLLSGAVFYKDISSFISQGVIEGGVPVDTGNGIEIFDAIGPINGKGGKVQGLEFGYQQIFDFLPSPFDGLGLQFNYTYTDSSVDIPYIEGDKTFNMPLEGLSEDSYNIVAFWEKERFSFRVAYNYRDAFLSNRTNPQGNPVYTDQYGQLDASFNWYINKTFTLALNGININNEARYQYFLEPDRMLAWRASGPRYSIGLRARF